MGMSARDADARPAAGQRTALHFVVLIGLTSLFADMTYEGSRGVTGPFLGTLGATGALVATIAGAGEFVGYALRWVSGVLADRTRRYWAITLAGYAINLLAVPTLALAGTWQAAAAFIILERTGKALRTPARDAMLAHAGRQLGRTGWAFGLHEALDQTGATLGPLIVAGVLALRGDYRLAFAWLLVPALLALSVLVLARLRFPRPHDLEINRAPPALPGGRRDLLLFFLATALIAAGYADFPLIAYRLGRDHVLDPAWIPVLYSLGNVAAGAAALVLGRAYDRHGLGVLIHATVVPALFAPLVMLGGAGMAVAGMLLWGIGFGAHDTLLRAAVADRVAKEQRASVLGAFNTFYGLAWFAGSAVLGVLFDLDPLYLVVASLALQWLACVVLLVLRRSSPPLATGAG